MSRKTKWNTAEQDNELFSLVKNTELDCYDLVFKKASYDTSSELLGVVSFIHQMGMRKMKLRIGALLKNCKIVEEQN